MYLDERSNSLLKEVIGNPEISNARLEEKYQLSRRQISYSFKKINDWLLEKNFPAIKRTNSGKFIVNPVLIELFTETIEPSKQKYIPSEKERAVLILLMILSSNEELSLIHFTSVMEVSKNTILRDLKSAQNIVAKYDLTIVYSRVKGYDLSGTEWNKRKLLVDVLQSVFSIYNGESYIEQIIEIQGKEIQRLKAQMEEVETRLHLKFSDERMKLLPYVIAIISKRINRGKLVSNPYHIDYEELSDTKEFEAAEILIQDGKDIPKAERLFLTLQLLTSNVLSSQFLTKNELPQFIQALRDSLDLFEKKAVIVLKDKDALLERLVLHMKPAYYRIKYHLTTNYSMIEKFSEEFDAIHYIVKDSIKPLEEYIGCSIPESEVMFITIFLGGHLINSGETIQIKKKAVVVCPNGVSISKLMENTLRGLFPEIYFYNALSVREFENFNREIDIVFSPVPLQTDKQLFIVERFITDFEKVQLRQRVMKTIFGLNSSVINVNQIVDIIGKYAKIEEKQGLINALQDYFSIQESDPTKQKAGCYLSDLITPETMVIRDHVDSWHDAIKIASEPLLNKGVITKQYVDTMLEQYPTMSPYILLRMNIAIPHASPEDGVRSIGMSLLKINNGLDVGGNQKIHLVVVIAAVDKNQHFQALMQLMKLASTSADIKKMIQMDALDQLYELIQTYSK
ncbi:PTS sugar transporter subunit IIA [Heyndrickxia sporothermodurans]|uniref:BglG family transcription antiterminator n=1 Tax=Heyndrickxia TaxID=2837504 RepID=UPI000D3A1A22|nr:BglG family transcription antiterminator [Heyndrickxia sporothermodurans]PTY77665.1 PTS sugar transporter subunit IIA [Heyndrickxia sporothermodurans]